MEKRVMLILALCIVSLMAVSVLGGSLTGVCGDGVLNIGEKCESPGTTANTFCPETEANCKGMMLGVRPAFGECNANCKCFQDQFTYSCVKGECGAACATSEDCPQSTEKCVGNQLATRPEFATCHFNCNCQETVFGTPKCVAGECGAVCAFKSDCTQTTEKCFGTKLGTRSGIGECSPNCQCKETSFTDIKCVTGECGAQCATNSECADQTKCVGTKLSTALGKCDSSCGCAVGNFGSPICVTGECGAVCSKDSDCNDNDASTADKCLSDCIYLNNSFL